MAVSIGRSLGFSKCRKFTLKCVQEGSDRTGNSAGLPQQGCCRNARRVRGDVARRDKSEVYGENFPKNKWYVCYSNFSQLQQPAAAQCCAARKISQYMERKEREGKKTTIHGCEFVFAVAYFSLPFLLSVLLSLWVDWMDVVPPHPTAPLFSPSLSQTPTPQSQNFGCQLKKKLRKHRALSRVCVPINGHPSWASRAALVIRIPHPLSLPPCLSCLWYRSFAACARSLLESEQQPQASFLFFIWTHRPPTRLTSLKSITRTHTRIVLLSIIMIIMYTQTQAR